MMPGIYDSQIKPRVAALIVWLVALFTTFRLWIENMQSTIVARIFARTYATYGGRRLVCAFVGGSALTTRPGSASADAATITAAGMTDVTPDIAYLLAEHKGAPSIGVVCRRLALTVPRPVILIIYIADTSFGLSRSVIDLDADTEVLTRTDLSAINLAVMPVVSVCAL